jgi:hypothetical protein
MPRRSRRWMAYTYGGHTLRRGLLIHPQWVAGQEWSPILQGDQIDSIEGVGKASNVNGQREGWLRPWRGSAFLALRRPGSRTHLRKTGKNKAPGAEHTGAKGHLT